MQTEPTLEYQEEVPYMAIFSQVTMQEIPALLPPLIPEMAAWLKAHDAAPAGPPFFHYINRVNGVLDVEVGFPVETALADDDRVRAGVFPAGRYATITHMGPYTLLPQIHAALDAWAKANAIELRGDRTEFYPIDPATEPDPNNFRTDIRMLVAESQN